MDPKNPRWLAADARRARSAFTWKFIVSVVTAVALGTVLVFTWLDRRDAKRSESSTTRTTSADVRPDRPVSTSASASMTDTSSGISPRAYGAAMPIPPAAQERAPSTHDSSTGAAAGPSALRPPAPAPVPAAAAAPTPAPAPAPAPAATLGAGRSAADWNVRDAAVTQGAPPENGPAAAENGAASPEGGTAPQPETSPARPDLVPIE